MNSHWNYQFPEISRIFSHADMHKKELFCKILLGYVAMV